MLELGGHRFYSAWSSYSSRPSSLHVGIAAEAIAELEALLDYIFKTPRFLEAEAASELSKLESYFPSHDTSEKNQRLRRIRAHREFENINHRFPKFLRSANLLIATSLMEYHVARLVAAHCSILGERFDPHLGLVDLIDKIAAWRPNLKDDPNYVPVDSAIKIRNRLVHDGGRLTHTRKCAEIRRIVSERLYIAEYYKDHWDKNALEIRTVRISTLDGFDWIQMEEEYAFEVAAYFRDFYMSACLAIDPVA